MGDVLTLIEKAEAAFDAKKAAELEQKLKSNKFTLADFYDQLVQLKGHGQPAGYCGHGSRHERGRAQNTQLDEKALTRTEAIIQSMTPYERENPSVLNHSRKRRIAAGAGVVGRADQPAFEAVRHDESDGQAVLGPGASKKMKRMGKMGGFRRHGRLPGHVTHRFS